MGRKLGWGGTVALIFLLLACMGLAAPLDLAVALALGWAVFLVRVAPRVTIDWSGVAMAVACLAAFAVGLHVFLRWLVVESRGQADRRWLPRWTAAAVGVIVLMFVSGIAAAGIAHQVGWLLTSKEPWIDAHSAAAQRAQSVNNLKQIGIALYSYHDRHNTFPPGGTFDLHGRPLHGWQTRLLPYIEQEALYRRIDLGHPWDDPSNAPAFRADLPIYRIPRVQEETDRAGYALNHYAGNARVLGGDIPRNLEAIRDGTSQTFIAGEAAGRYKAWGYPTNWRDPAKGINRSPDGFGSPFVNGANFLFVDGSVRFLKETIDPKVFKALSTPAGGESISGDAY